MRKYLCIVVLILMFAQLAKADCSGVPGLIGDLASTGLLKRRGDDWSQVYVSRDWYRMEFERKKSVAVAIAKCMAPNGAVYFYDVRSGKEVARFTNFGGFKASE